MHISRNVNIILNWLFNELLPPVIRDCRWCVWLPFRGVFGAKAPLFLDFHQKLYTMSDREFVQLNADAQSAIINRHTDLNKACLQRIMEAVCGPAVLEAGCGRGYLSSILAKKYNVTAVDIALPPDLPIAENPRFLQSNLERLPFADNAFDTVICTHTLEHVRNIQGALSELRRVCRKRFIIVVPCERPYSYTPNLHVHFFPYAFSLVAVTGVRAGQVLQKLGGDWYYQEDK